MKTHDFPIKLTHFSVKHDYLENYVFAKMKLYRTAFIKKF